MTALAAAAYNEARLAKIAAENAGGGGGGQYECVYVSGSRTVLAPFTGKVKVRMLGAAGGGYQAATGSGANAGTVAFATVDVIKGDAIVITIPVGGAVSSAGGTLTVTGTGGLNASVPGGRAGVASGTPAANAVPTGVDEYWLGGLGGASGAGAGGGGSAAVLIGSTQGQPGGSSAYANAGGGGAGVGAPGNNAQSSTSGGFGGGSGSGFTNLFGNSSGLATLTESHSRLLVNVSGSTSYAGQISPGGGGVGGNNSSAGGVGGGFGAGGGGGGSYNSGFSGSGGVGGGGGGGPSAGKGGNGFVTLEFFGD